MQCSPSVSVLVPPSLVTIPVALSPAPLHPFLGQSIPLTMQTKSTNSALTCKSKSNTSNSDDKLVSRIRCDPFRSSKVVKLKVDRNKRPRAKEYHNHQDPTKAVSVATSNGLKVNKELGSEYAQSTSCASQSTISEKSGLRKVISAKSSRDRYSNSRNQPKAASRSGKRNRTKQAVSSSVRNLADKEVKCKLSSVSKKSTHKSKSRVNKNSGFITCSVCNRIKFYSHVQRRYGIFSCEPCFKFFSRFIKEPRLFQCSNEDKCIIVVENEAKNNFTGSRCKACWLKLCLDKFRINSDTKQSILSNYYPQSHIGSRIEDHEASDRVIEEPMKNHSSSINRSTNPPHERTSRRQSEDSLSSELTDQKCIKPAPDVSIESSSESTSVSTRTAPKIILSKNRKSGRMQIKTEVSVESDVSVDKPSAQPESDNSMPEKEAECSPEPVEEMLPAEASCVTYPAISCAVQSPVDASPGPLSNSSTSSGSSTSSCMSNSSSSSCSSSSSSSCSSSSSSSCSPPTPTPPPIQSPRSEHSQAAPTTPAPASTYSSLPTFNNSFFPQYPVDNSSQETALATSNPSPALVGGKSPNSFLFKCEESNFGQSQENSNSNRSSVQTNSDNSETSYKELCERKTDQSLTSSLDSSHFLLGMQNCSDYNAINFKEANKLMNGKKSRCKECEGCRAQDCGQCTYCLDKKKFGGQNVIKQACKFRVCIRFKQSQKNQMGSPSPNPSNCSNQSAMSPPSNKAPSSSSSSSKHQQQHLSASSSSSSSVSSHHPKSCAPSIQSPSFFPTPPPHSSSQHSSPSLVSNQGPGMLVASSQVAPSMTPSTSMSSYCNSVSHLSSLPTPTSSPLPQGPVPSHYPHKSNEISSLCEYPNYQHYMATSCSNNFNQNGLSGCNYSGNNYETANLSQQYGSNSLNYYPTVNNLNFNYKLNNCSSPKVSAVSNHVNYGQYQNEYPLSNTVSNSSYKNNCLYLGEYTASQQAAKNNWHATTYQLSNNHYQVRYANLAAAEHSLSPQQTQDMSNTFYGHQHSNLSCHGNYYDGYY